MNTTISKDHVNEFVQLINKGVEAWVKAGEILVEMIEEDTNAYDRIMMKDPRIKYETLCLIEKLGRKQIHPNLLFDNSYAAKTKIPNLPYCKQAECYESPLEVVKMVSSRVSVDRKKASEMTRFEADLVFSKTSIRTVQEQVDLIKSKKFEISFAPPSYEIQGKFIKFRANTSFSREEIEEIISKLPKSIDSLEKTIKKNQISK